MATQRRLQIVAIGILIVVGLQAEPAAAQYCFWDGSGPICRGQCPGGYKTKKVKTAGCLNGYKVLCCEPVGSVSQYQKRRR